MILAIDPGPIESAYLVLENGNPLEFGKQPNDWIMEFLEEDHVEQHLAVEMIASYGMPVGREVFETCVWIGRFIQAWGGSHTLVYRRDVKLYLCNSARAKDGNVRAALIDKYGGKDKAIGKKATPGPLYGVSADVWSALAVAVTYSAGAAS